MRVDFTKPKKSSFSVAGDDLYKIMQKLLSNQNLLKLLAFSSADALSKEDLTDEQVSGLIGTNIKVIPKLPIPEEVGSYIIISFDNFIPNDNNPVFRDNLITFDVLCYLDDWLMDDYLLRPYKIMHEIDEMFNGSKLNGIGRVEFIGANSLILSADLAGFTVNYRVINDV